MQVQVADWLPDLIEPLTNRLTGCSFFERVHVFVAACVSDELALLTFVVIDLEGNLPRSYVSAVFDFHPIERAPHLHHRRILDAQLIAAEKHLVVCVQVRVENHIAHPELLPGLVELDLFDSTTYVGALVLLLLRVIFHVVEVVWRLEGVADDACFGLEQKIGDAVSATLPTNDVVVLDNGVFVVEILLVRNHRLDTLPDDSILAPEDLRKLALLLPVIQLVDGAEHDDSLPGLRSVLDAERDFESLVQMIMSRILGEDRPFCVIEGFVALLELSRKLEALLGYELLRCGSALASRGQHVSKLTIIAIAAGAAFCGLHD